MHALHIIEAELAAHSSEAASLAYWWTNLAHLRGLLYSGGSSGVRGPAPPPWASQALQPRTLKIEREAFESLLQALWQGCLLPLVNGSKAGGAGGVAGAGGAASLASPRQAVPTASKRAQQVGAEGEGEKGGGGKARGYGEKR